MAWTLILNGKSERIDERTNWVTSYKAANINVQIVRDLVASPNTQIKQALSVGLSYSIF